MFCFSVALGTLALIHFSLLTIHQNILSLRCLSLSHQVFPLPKPLSDILTYRKLEKAHEVALPFNPPCAAVHCVRQFVLIGQYMTYQSVTEAASFKF